MKYLFRSSRKERVRIPGTIRQVAIYVHYRASLGEVREVRRVSVSKRRKGTGEEEVSATPIRTLTGLNGPRLIRHKRLILKNSGRDKLFRGPRILLALRSLAYQAVTEFPSGAD